MLLMLSHLDEKYGGVEAYLEGAGLSTSEINRLKGLLLAN